METQEVSKNQEDSHNILQEDEGEDCQDGGTVAETLSLLREGDDRIKLDEDQRDLILLVGNSGSGKSTAAQFLAGDNDELISYAKGKSTFLIRDREDKISTHTTISKSIFPELILNDRIDPPTAFYDCPGFSDTRKNKPEIEIGNAFFIKKVADHAQRVKIVVVVKHNAVQAGEDRDEFTGLLQQLTILLKEPAKFVDCLALIATKVKGSESNEDVIEDIASFLQDVKDELPDCMDPQILPASLQILDALLLQSSHGDDDTQEKIFERIGVFRQPTEAGPLSQIKKMQEDKLRLEEMIHRQLQFVPKTENDFGFALSSDSILVINDLLEKISRNVRLNFQSLGKIIQHQFLQQMDHWASSTSNESADLSSSTTELDNFRGKLLSLIEFGSKIDDESLTTISEETKPSIPLNDVLQQVQKFKLPSTPLSADKDKEEKLVKGLQNQAQYLDFLQSAKGMQNVFNILEPSRWTLPLKQVAATVMRHVLISFAGQLHKKIINSLDQLAEQLKAEVMSKVTLSSASGAEGNHLDVFDVRRELKKHFDRLVNFKETIEREALAAAEAVNKEEGKLTPTIFVKRLLAEFEVLENGKTFQEKVAIISGQLQHLDLIDLVSKAGRNFASALVDPASSSAGLQWEPLRWLQPLQSLLTRIQGQYRWYDFLVDLARQLSDSKVQVYDEFQLKQAWRQLNFDLSDLGSFNKFWKSFQPILSPGVADHQAILDSMTFDQDGKLKILKELLDTCLTTDMTTQFDPVTKTCAVQGTFLVLSQVLKTVQASGQPTESLILLALNTIFVDQNLIGADIGSRGSNQVNSVNVTILAPTWWVNPDNTKSINLSGRPGSNGGSWGSPGSPGGNAGNFCGMGQTFLGGKLHVFGNGGNGGSGHPGQNGQEGRAGRQVSAGDIKGSAWQEGRIRIDYTPYGFHADHQWSDKWFQFYGEPGGPGSAGGHGGKGGAGGHASSIIMPIPVNGNSNITLTSSSAGSSGSHGRGGSGGIGGRRWCWNAKIFAFNKGWSDYWCEFTPGNQQEMDRGPSGSNGTTGGNSSGWRPATTPSYDVTSNVKYLNLFKEVATERMAKFSDFWGGNLRAFCRNWK